MGNLREIIKGYFEGQEKIFEAFGTSSWEELNSHIGEKWYVYVSGDMQYLDSEGEQYTFESVYQVGDVVDGLVLFYVQENGEKFYSIFEKSEELTEDEANEKFTW